MSVCNDVLQLGWWVKGTQWHRNATGGPYRPLHHNVLHAGVRQEHHPLPVKVGLGATHMHMPAPQPVSPPWGHP